MDNESKADAASVERVAEGRQRILTELRKVIVGQDDVVDQLLMAIFAGGHCLLVGRAGPGEDAARPHAVARSSTSTSSASSSRRT